MMFTKALGLLNARSLILTTAVLDKKTLDRLQEIQKLPEDERRVIYKSSTHCCAMPRLNKRMRKNIFHSLQHRTSFPKTKT